MANDREPNRHTKASSGVAVKVGGSELTLGEMYEVRCCMLFRRNPNLNLTQKPSKKGRKRYKVTLPKGTNLHLRFGCYG